MELPDYPANNLEPVEKKSHKEEKKIESVVKEGVSVKEKSRAAKFMDTVHSALDYVTKDVLLPAAKDMASDAVSSAVDQILFGDSRSSRSNRRERKTNGHVSYDRYSKAPGHSSSMSNRARARHDFAEIVLESRAEAENVIDQLFELVSKYESATVSDLYELVGVTPKYTDDNWGWLDMRGACVRRTRRGYLLDLPEPVALD